MQVSITLTEADLTALILREVNCQLGKPPGTYKADDIIIEVKSRQNYKSEWEKAAFRARVEVTT